MTTKAEIVQRVAEDLAITAIDQAPEHQDKVRVEQAYDHVYARLKIKGLATWASNADIPAEVTPYIELMMAEKLLTKYSVPEARYNRIKLEAGEDGNLAMANIAELTIPEHESTDGVENF